MVQISNGKNRRPHKLALKFHRDFSLLVRFDVRVNRAVGKHIGSGNIRSDAPVLIEKIAIRTGYRNRTLSTVRPGKAAMQIGDCVEGILRMIRRDVEIVGVIEVTTEGSLRQREL